jgi:ribonuclease PH
MTRSDGRKFNELRKIEIIPGFMPNAEGSVLISCGNTKVICTASIEDKVPNWMKGKGESWITAEYGILPRSTNERVQRERTKVGGRTAEIQRLIGRSLRAIIDMKKLGEKTIMLDADVIQADGGTRTASITGCYVALEMAVKWMQSKGMLTESPLTERLAAVSVGLVEGQALLDLNYVEDVAAEVDMNLVMTESGKFIEIQGTAESHPFDKAQRDALFDVGWTGIQKLIQLQKSINH